MKNLEQIVQNNLDSYNKKDIENFMLTFDENIKMYQFGQDKPVAIGKTEVKKLYNNLFKASPKLHSTILNRIIFDNKVIDYESIVGRMGSDEVIEMILIYEVLNGKIVKTTAIKK